MAEHKTLRGLSAEMLEALDRLTDDAIEGAWWRDVLGRRDLFVAIRRESLNVYYRGASLFQVSYRDGIVTPYTHAKYLSRRQQGLVPLRGGQFGIEAGKALWSSYSPQTLAEMMAAAANLAGPEKIHLHALLLASPHVIDVEVSLDSSLPVDQAPDGAILAAEEAVGGETEGAVGRAKQDRLDLAALERHGTAIRVVFHEAKHFSNPELRASSARTPKVAAQIERYRATLKLHADDLAWSYREVCRALSRIGVMRQRLQRSASSIDPLVAAVAQGSALPAIDLEPRLVLFGFDQDQRDGAIWQQHHRRLVSAPPDGYGLKVTALGSTVGRKTPAFREPATPP